MKVTIWSILILLVIDSLSAMNFERMIWVYWQTDIEKAPLVTRISYEKLMNAAKDANWTVNLVNGQNARNFIPDYERFEDVVKRGYRNTVQEKSDILRITLVEANGGVWIDFACILFEGLEWLSDEKFFQHLIINRIGNNKQDPDMFVLGQGYLQSPLTYYNQDGVLVGDEYVGLAIIFVAAKKKSPIMTAWKQKMYNLTTLSYQQFLPQINTKRLYFHNIDRDTMYYSGNLALQSVIQEKQIEFDDQLTLYSKRVNVYENFKIWTVHGEVGPILMTRKHLINGRDLFLDTRQEIESRAGKLWFQLKMAKFLREEIEERQTPTQKYFTKNNLTIKQILQRGPTIEQCSLYFIVQGSILYNFYKGSKYESQIKTPFITIAQRQQLKSRCWYISPSIYFSSHSFKSEGQMVRPERELLYGKVNTILGYLRFYWMINQLVFWAWLEWFKIFVYMIVTYVICKYLLMRLDARKISGIDSEDEFTFEEISARESSQSLETKRKLRCKKPSGKQLVAVTGLSIVVSATLQFYEEIQDMGKYPQYQCTLLLIFLALLSKGLLKKLISSFSSSTFFNLKNFIKNIRFAFYLPMAFCVFIHFDIVYSFAYYHTMVIGGGGLLLYGLLEELDEREMTNWGFKIVRKGIKLVKWVVIGIFLAFYVWPNLRYLRKQNRYTKEHISEVALSIFWAIFIPTIVGIFIILYKTLKSINSQQQAQSSNPHLTKNSICQMIFMTLIAVLLTYQSQSTYSTIIQSPTSYFLMSDFQAILAVYTLFGVAMRTRVPEEISFSQFVRIFGGLNFFPVMFGFFGMRFIWVMETIVVRWVILPFLPFYIILAVLASERMNKLHKRSSQDDSSNMFQEVELHPNILKE